VPETCSVLKDLSSIPQRKRLKCAMDLLNHKTAQHTIFHFKRIMSSSSSSPSGNVTATAAGPNEVTPSQGHTVQGITQFADDTLGVTAEPLSVSSQPLVPFMDVPGADSIITFLERPTVLFSGSFTTSDSTYLLSGDPFALLAGGVKSSKLQGIYGIKADLVLTLNVNATRFQTGRYIMGWIPSGGLPIGSANFAAYVKSHGTTLVNITQLPHVEIDIASQTSVELVIPWENVYPYWVNLSSYPVGVGMFFLYPYSTLNAASGDTTAGYTVWGAFKNIGLSGPTVTQSGARREAKSAGIGPIEAALGKVSSASTILGEFPLLTPLASTVSWSADILKRASHIFGWEKPTNLAPPVLHKVSPMRFVPNVDGASMAQPLAGMSTNEVCSLPPHSIRKVDEMSIDFVKKVYSFQKSFAWSSSSGVGTNLLTFGINPSLYTTVYGSGYVFAPIGFLSTLFQFWRGAIKFRFKLVANEFYSGRIAVYFEPNYHGQTHSTTVANSEFDERVIVDIRETKEFEVEVPYVSPEMYTSTANTVSTGSLMICVIDPLVAPNTVPSTITVLIEVAGGDDLEFAGPLNPQLETWVPFVTQSNRASDLKAYPTFKLGKNLTSSIEPASVCIGEKFESLRQYWKIPYITPLTGGGLIQPLATSKVQDHSPYLCSVVTQPTSISTALSRSYMYGDTIDLITSIYCFSTGSMRLIFPEEATSATFMVGPMFNYMVQRILTNSFVQVAQYAPLKWISCRIGSELLDFIVPPYMQTYARPVVGNYFNNGSTSLVPDTTTCSKSVVRIATATTTNLYTQRQPADDMNCFSFVSIPSMVSYSQT